jgi:hypothetical protein
MSILNICTFCLKENGHTTHCDELKKKPASAIFSIPYYLLRATMSNYKAQGGETDPHLAAMWEKSTTFWCEGIAKMIVEARDACNLKSIYMPEA